MWEELAGLVRRMDRRVEELETQDSNFVVEVVIYDASDPPTLAEINGAFGTATDVGEGFVGILVDTIGLQLGVWLCVSANGNWYYEELNLAV